MTQERWRWSRRERPASQDITHQLDGTQRVAMGADAYKMLNAAHADRSALLETQQTLATSTDY